MESTSAYIVGLELMLNEVSTADTSSIEKVENRMLARSLSSSLVLVGNLTTPPKEVRCEVLHCRVGSGLYVTLAVIPSSDQLPLVASQYEQLTSTEQFGSM